ncbi:hypothetical protein [Kitasatospora aureofaciens]|uniref:hypothetical protein n=1 Tax=Kitasatospora aureofaciens TaxID=1894 RepID=UPI0033DF7DC2
MPHHGYEAVQALRDPAQVRYFSQGTARVTSPTNGMSASEIIAALREKLDGRATTIVRYPDTVEHVRRLSDEIAGLPADDGSNGVGKGGKTGPGDHRAITEALDRLMSETGPLGRDPEVLERVRRLDRAVTAAADAVPSTEELSVGILIAIIPYTAFVHVMICPDLRRRRGMPSQGQRKPESVSSASGL